uniref:Defective in cullin neddylation protein n=1 Tax=Arcella intermedia TaxID=1963864 RepID=A0A6B2LK17_9EUKA
MTTAFDKYSAGADSISGEGLLHLATDLGSTGPMDPTLLLLAWVLFSSQQWEISREEWLLSWSLQGLYDLPDIQKHLKTWKNNTLEDKTAPLFKNFYQFVFEYLKVPKTSHMEKSEALVAWKIVGVDQQWGLFGQWEAYLEGHASKIVSRDTWNMLIRFIEKMGTLLENYDENDSWPLFIDEFVKHVKGNL